MHQRGGGEPDRRLRLARRRPALEALRLPGGPPRRAQRHLAPAADAGRRGRRDERLRPRQAQLRRRARSSSARLFARPGGDRRPERPGARPDPAAGRASCRAALEEQQVVERAIGIMLSRTGGTRRGGAGPAPADEPVRAPQAAAWSRRRWWTRPSAGPRGDTRPSARPPSGRPGGAGRQDPIGASRAYCWSRPPRLPEPFLREARTPRRPVRATSHGVRAARSETAWTDVVALGDALHLLGSATDLEDDARRPADRPPSGRRRRRRARGAAPVVAGQDVRLVRFLPGVRADDVTTSLRGPARARPGRGTRRRGPQVIFYGGRPGAFVDLAADLAHAQGLPAGAARAGRSPAVVDR